MRRGAFFSRYPYRASRRESVHLLQTSAALSSSSQQMGTGASHNLSDEAIEALKTLPEHIQREIAAAAEAATPAVNISTPRAEPQPPQATEPQEEPAASATATTEEETAVEAEAFAESGRGGEGHGCRTAGSRPRPPAEWQQPAAFYAAMKPLEPGGAAPFRFLKGSWIREQAKKIRKAKEDGDEAALKSLAIKFRQEMPEEAFMTVEEVERLSGTIGYVQTPRRRRRVVLLGDARAPRPRAQLVPRPRRRAREVLRGEEARGWYGYDPIQRIPQGHRNILGLPVSFQHPPGGKRTEEQDRVFKVRAAPPLLLLLCCSLSRASPLSPHTHARSLASRTSIWSMRTKARPSFGSSIRRRPPARLTYARAGTTHTPLPDSLPALTTAAALPDSLPTFLPPPSSLHSGMDHLSRHARLLSPSSLFRKRASSPLTCIPSPSPHRHTDASRILKAQFPFLWPAVIDVGESAANDEGASADDDRRIPREDEDASLYKRSGQAGGRRVVREDAACGARRLEGAELRPESRLGRCGGRGVWRASRCARGSRSWMSADNKKIGNEGLDGVGAGATTARHQSSRSWSSRTTRLATRG